MNGNTAETDRSTVQQPTAPSIERGRYTRAVIESFDVERDADRLYHVTHGGETYHVDIENGGCTCPDFEYRGSEYLCKHVLKAALVEVFANTVSTRLVARVVAHAREQGCPVGGIDCDGPAGPRLPCPACIQATGAGEWIVWNKVVTESRR